MKPYPGDGRKRYWLATEERELEAIRRMCSYYITTEGPRQDDYMEDFEIAIEWYKVNRGVYDGSKRNFEGALRRTESKTSGGSEENEPTD